MLRRHRAGLRARSRTGSRSAVSSGSDRWGALASARAFTPHFAGVFELGTLAGGAYERAVGGGPDPDTVSLAAYDAALYLRASTDVVGRWLGVYALAGGGPTLGILTYKTQQTRVAPTSSETDVGYLVGGGAGITARFPRFTTLFAQGGYAYAPTIRNLIGDTHDSGGLSVVLGLKDLGVSFLDDASGSLPGTQISQTSEESEATCILFTSVGDIDPSAAMTLSVDFDSDGTIDYSAPLGATSWHQVQTQITAPAAYRGITFRVTKSGTGTAILAEMRITSTTGCTAKAPILRDLPLGDTCGGTADCAQGLVCSQQDGGLHLCSQCSNATPCAGGAACAQRSVFLPFQCGPGQGLGQSGAWCLANGDCASGACQGAKVVGLLSDDAGVCDLDRIGPGDPTNCSWDSALGGTCR